jgi:sugar phosphate isomerase/epimerase
MRTGISSWTYPWAVGVPGHPAPPFTALDLVTRAAGLGVGVVQIGDNLPLHELPPEELAALRARADESGIAVEVATRGVEPWRLRQYLAIAQILGARLLRTLTRCNGPCPDLRQIASWLKEALPEFESAGVSIALENYELHSACELASLIDRVGSGFLGVCFDTANSLGALETPAQAAETLAPYVINVHVKDFVIERIDTQMGYVVRGSPAGNGRMNLPLLLEKIDRHGRRPNLILEQWPPFTETVLRTISLESEWAAQGVRFLKSFE